MDLYRRPNSPFFWYRFTVGGVTYRGSTKRPLNDATGAKRVLADLYGQHMNRSQFGEKPPITMSEAFDRAIEAVEGNTASSYDLVKRRTLGLGSFNRRGWYAIDPDMPLHRLGDGHLEDLVRARRKADNSDNTINIDLRVIKRVVNLSKRRFKAPDDLTYPMLESFEKTRFLTREEEAEIMAIFAAKSAFPAYVKARDLFVFLIDTGVRLSEALGVTWRSVNLSKRQIEVYRKKTKSLSIVPISDRVALMLQRRHNEASPFENMSRSLRILRKVIDEVCNGDETINRQRGKATVHSLRDTYASRLAGGGMSLHKVAKLLGHTSLTMTRKYAQLEAQDVAEEARMMMNG